MKTATINGRQVNLGEVHTVDYQGPSVTVVYSQDGGELERKVLSPARLRLNLHSGELIIVPEEDAEDVWTELSGSPVFA